MRSAYSSQGCTPQETYLGSDDPISTIIVLSIHVHGATLSLGTASAFTFTGREKKTHHVFVNMNTQK